MGVGVWPERGPGAVHDGHVPRGPSPGGTRPDPRSPTPRGVRSSGDNVGLNNNVLLCSLLFPLVTQSDPLPRHWYYSASPHPVLGRLVRSTRTPSLPPPRPPLPVRWRRVPLPDRGPVNPRPPSVLTPPEIMTIRHIQMVRLHPHAPLPSQGLGSPCLWPGGGQLNIIDRFIYVDPDGNVVDAPAPARTTLFVAKKGDARGFAEAQGAFEMQRRLSGLQRYGARSRHKEFEKVHWYSQEL